ncbi:MAG: hypothetical protein EHM42_13985, partial [Planctomycetaceae bacterium]
RFWVRHNLAESLPFPTPLTWDLWRQFMLGSGGYGRLFRTLGFRPAARVCREGFLELIAGRIYADPHRLVEMFCKGYPLRFDEARLRNDPAALDSSPSTLDLEQLDPWFLWRWPLVAATLIRARWRTHRQMRVAAQRFETRFVPRLRAAIERERQTDLTRLPFDDLIAVFDSRRRWLFDDVAPESLLPGTLGVAAWGDLRARLDSVLGPIDGGNLASRLLSQISDPVARRQRDCQLWLVAGQVSPAEFLAEFGHRGPDEMDLSFPRWREWPRDELISQFAAPTGNVPRDVVPAASCDASGLLRQALRRGGASCLFEELAESLRLAQCLLPYRALGKHELLRGYELLREVTNELSQRVELGAGIHFLCTAELRQLPSRPELENVARERRERRRHFRWLNAPPVITGPDDLDAGRSIRSQVIAKERRLAAAILSRGLGRGEALLLTSDHDLARVAGAVVIASSLSAGFVPRLAEAAALIVEQGGALSHVAMLARELAIPAVVLGNATRVFSQGMQLCVNAESGWIEILEPAV